MTKQFYKTHLITYASIYVIKTYYLWEFTNPFWWIIELPNETPGHRFAILGLIIFYLFVIAAITSMIKDYKIYQLKEKQLNAKQDA